MKKVFPSRRILNDQIVGAKLTSLDPLVRKEIEEWVVNTVKVKMIKKLENSLEVEGKANLRKLFLVPIFSIREFKDWVTDKAPEIKTPFFKELIGAIEEVEKRLASV